MRVNIFNYVMASKPQETELDKIVYMMQFSQELCNRTQIYRQYLIWKGKKKSKKYKITRFPAFAPCAIFYDGKTKNDIVGMTDLCYLDIDDIKKDAMIREAMTKLCNDEHVLMASRSVSNNGLHILIRYQLKDVETPPQRVAIGIDEMEIIYGEVFDLISKEYEQNLDMKIDKHSRHMEQLYIVSYDLDMYYNPNAVPIIIDVKGAQTK